MILLGRDIKPEHYGKLAIYTSKDKQVLGWIYPSKEYISDAEAVLYNDFTEELVEIYENDTINILEYKYVISEPIDGVYNTTMFILSDIEWIKFRKSLQDSGFKLVWENNYYGKFLYKDRIVYTVTKAPEDIYIPTFIHIMEKYKKYVKHPEDNTGRDK